MSNERSYRTVDIERRGYGRRYTWLPVDSLSRQGFSIDFTDSYMRPGMIDIRPGDIVRWSDSGRLIQAVVSEVRRESDALHAVVEGAHPLPPDAFFP